MSESEETAKAVDSWSVAGSTDAEVSKAMTRLKDGLPAQG